MGSGDVDVVGCFGLGLGSEEGAFARRRERYSGVVAGTSKPGDRIIRAESACADGFCLHDVLILDIRTVVVLPGAFFEDNHRIVVEGPLQQIFMTAGFTGSNIAAFVVEINSFCCGVNDFSEPDRRSISGGRDV